MNVIQEASEGLPALREVSVSARTLRHYRRKDIPAEFFMEWSISLPGQYKGCDKTKDERYNEKVHLDAERHLMAMWLEQAMREKWPEIVDIAIKISHREIERCKP